MNAPQDFRSMTADTLGRDLLQALVAEIQLLPDPWKKLSKAKQDDVIDRLRARVETNVKMAVHLLAAQGRTVVAGDLDQITIKGGVKAVVKIGSRAESLHELYDSAGQAVLIVVANAADHTGGMDEVRGEADQRAMNLGHEYHDNDGGGMDEADDNIVDAEFFLPAPGDTAPTTQALEEAFDAGYRAASEDKPQADCPVMKGALCIEWLKGWKGWHEDNDSNWWQQHGDNDDFGGEAA